MTEKEKCAALETVLEKARIQHQSECYIRAGWAISNITERLDISEDEVRNAIEACRKKGIRLGDVIVNLMIRKDHPLPEIIQDTGWTADEIRAYMERGARLKADREAAGFTAEMIARRLDVPLREIVRLEAGNYGDELLLECYRKELIGNE